MCAWKDVKMPNKIYSYNRWLNKPEYAKEVWKHDGYIAKCCPLVLLKLSSWKLWNIFWYSRYFWVARVIENILNGNDIPISCDEIRPGFCLPFPSHRSSNDIITYLPDNFSNGISYSANARDGTISSSLEQKSIRASFFIEWKWVRTKCFSFTMIFLPLTRMQFDYVDVSLYERQHSCHDYNVRFDSNIFERGCLPYRQ